MIQNKIRVGKVDCTTGCGGEGGGGGGGGVAPFGLGHGAGHAFVTCNGIMFCGHASQAAVIILLSLMFVCQFTT